MVFYRDKGFQKLFAIFFLVFVLVVSFHEKLVEWEIDPIVVIVGNILLLGTSLLTLNIFEKANSSKTPQGFVRNVYSAFVVKFFVLVVAAMLYFYFSDTISVRAVFLCMGFYFVYHFLGTSHAAVKARTHKHKHH
jgi:hypothetical protein